MFRLFMLLFFVLSGTVLADPVEHKLLCKEVDQDSDSGELVLSFEGGEYLLENSDRGCRSDYILREVSIGNSEPVIFSYPTSDDMGLNAQIMVFSAPEKNAKANNIGGIPAGASELQDGTFRDIQQSGGSIYENVYRIDKDKIALLVPSKELIISDEKCVFKKISGGACQKVRGSFKHPVCTLNYGERKVLADASECAGMRE